VFSPARVTLEFLVRDTGIALTQDQGKRILSIDKLIKSSEHL